jgi:hypothetical protein
MSKIKSLELDNGTFIMVESEEIESIDQSVNYQETEQTLISRGVLDNAVKEFNNIQKTIRDYTTYTLKAFQDAAHANVDKVTLEFGIKIGGEAGIPYITKGTAESNLKVTVECSFPEKK